MPSDGLVIGIVVLSILAFTLFVVLLMYKLFRTKRLYTGDGYSSGFTKEQMNTVVQLTPDEQKRWQQNLLTGFILFTLFFAVFVGFSGLSYWKFVVQGSPIQATVLGMASHQSGGRHSKTVYTYTLQALIDGEIIKDSYNAGSHYSSKVGDIVDAYATNEEAPELAIAAVEDRDPLIILGAILVYSFAVFGIVQQRKRVASGHVKISTLPKSMRRARLAALKLEKKEAPTSESSIYTIGKSNVPEKRAGDGSDYSV